MVSKYYNPTEFLEVFASMYSIPEYGKIKADF